MQEALQFEGLLALYIVRRDTILCVSCKKIDYFNLPNASLIRLKASTNLSSAAA